MKIRVKDFEDHIKVRQLKASDYEAVTALEDICFPKMGHWSKEQFNSQLTRFPAGQLCVEYKGKIVASSASLIVDFDLYSKWHDWLEIAGGGSIDNHSPEGNTLYGIEIMVAPEFRGMRLSRRLYQARKDLCRELNLQRIVLGGRIPGYEKYASKMSAREYVDRVVSKELFDPVLTPQLANGFVVQELIENYLPSDAESAGWATHLEWTNLEQRSETRRQLNATQIVRVSSVQYEMRKISNFTEFAQQVEYFVDAASDYRSDFILFPELFTLQLLSITKAQRPGSAARKLAEYTPQYLKLMTKLAIKHNINIVGGSQFCLEKEKLYNVAFLFKRDGKIERQYKIHITPSERRWWGVVGGSKVNVIDTDCGRVAINICYDIEFPELARIAAKKGAQIIFCPFNTDGRHGYLRVRYCAQARCIENHLYVITSGCTGNLPFVENADVHYAQSGIYTPADLPFSRDGVAAESTPNTETVIMHDLDLETVRRHRYQGSTLNWNDRRTDLYSIRFQEKDGEISV